MLDWNNYRRRTGLVIVLSGPSGVGKDCVLEEFIKLCPDVRRCITYTTRTPRAGEGSGKDYHFVSVEEFGRMVEDCWFLEFAEVHGNLYGTPRSWVEEERAAGRDVVLKIDVQGGVAVKRQIPDAVMVFLVPPSLEELDRRLRSRLTEADAELTKRLLDARSELAYISSYEYMIENDVVFGAASKLRAIVIAERSRIVSGH
ncbi:MAG: guanylate kinase [Armatimonadetes bacterium]|nr:guanylate kinase [Armatimonadota bacterium]